MKKPTGPTGRRRRTFPAVLATLGARIQLARKSKKLTLEDIGKACGVSPQAVGQWENNDAKPNIDRLERLAGVLDLSVADLLSESPPATMAEAANRLARVAKSVAPDKALARELEQTSRQLDEIGDRLRQLGRRIDRLVMKL